MAFSFTEFSIISGSSFNRYLSSNLIRADTSLEGLFQFSLEKAYRVR